MKKTIVLAIIIGVLSKVLKGALATFGLFLVFLLWAYLTSGYWITTPSQIVAYIKVTKAFKLPQSEKIETCSSNWKKTATIETEYKDFLAPGVNLSVLLPFGARSDIAKDRSAIAVFTDHNLYEITRLKDDRQNWRWMDRSQKFIIKDSLNPPYPIKIGTIVNISIDGRKYLMMDYYQNFITYDPTSINIHNAWAYGAKEGINYKVGYYPPSAEWMEKNHSNGNEEEEYYRSGLEEYYCLLSSIR